MLLQTGNPEEGNFGLSQPDPYELRLHEMLFADDVYRLCQLLTVPSFEAESAVYIVAPEVATPVVVSRKLDEQLWPLMMKQMEIDLRDAAVGKSLGIGPAAQTAALAKIHVSIHTERAEIDRATVDALAHACESALQRTRYHGPEGSVDGVTYHAGHWKPGKFFTGRVHSPAPGALSGHYIVLGQRLVAYAASTPSGRGAIKAELLAEAERLSARATNHH